MKNWIVLIASGVCAVALLAACEGEGPIVRPPPVPADYADKHMPEGWWTDAKIIEEGKQIYEGRFDTDVHCASCHGQTGKPKKRGARDFRTVERMKLYTDSHWFWRISEGVKRTKMKAWKKKLTEEQIWKVIAYAHTFSHDHQPALHDDYQPEPVEAMKR